MSEKVKLTDEITDIFMKKTLCGLSNSDGKHVPCDHESLPEKFRFAPCDCREAAIAVVAHLDARTLKGRD